ncbi:MAG: hypothetical protein V3S69_02630 [Dehalococcoidales bacterium]
MRIQYEKGDRVFTLAEYGNNSKEVVKVHKQGVTFETFSGERIYSTYSQIEATPSTISQATIEVKE